MSGDIKPFRIEIDQTDVDYLHDRLAHARWPGELTGVGWNRGAPLGWLKELVLQRHFVILLRVGAGCGAATA
jgi:hypothetical protein